MSHRHVASTGSRLDWHWNQRHNIDHATPTSPPHSSDAPSPPRNTSTVTVTKDHARAKTQTGRLACDVCRDRKVRCDREWPRCGRCVRVGDTCSYRGRAQRQSDLPRQVRELQARLEHAEAQLSTQQHTRQPAPEHASASSTVSTSRAPSVHGSIAARQPTTIPGSPHNGRAKHVSMASPSLALDLDFLPDLSGEAFGLPDVSLEWLNSLSAAEYVQENPGPIMAGKESWDITTSGTAESAQQATNELPWEIDGFQEDQPSPEALGKLHDRFFRILLPTMPILIEDRFVSLTRESPDSPNVQALSYAVALLGAMVSPGRQSLEVSCLNMARKYVDLCEQDDELVMSLELFQALLCIVRYELTHAKITRAWITVGRTVRLASMLGLHLSKPGVEGSEVLHALPPTTDPLLVEQRRRSFWTLYICETYASSRAHLPPLLQEDQISVSLPSPGALDDNFSPSTDLTLVETYEIRKLSGVSISAFTGVVLACAISRRCQPHAEAVTIACQSRSADNESSRMPAVTKPVPTIPNHPTKSFWDRHFSLLTVLRHRVDLLEPHLTVRAVQTDPVSFALYVYLCGIDVALQEAAVSQAKNQEFAPVVAADSEKRSRTAAYRLAGVAQEMMTDCRANGDFFKIHGAFVARPIAVAIRVLGRDLCRYSDEAHAASKVVLSLRLLLGALNQTETEGGYWHQMVKPIVSKLREWEDMNGNRAADTWGTALAYER